MTNTSFWISAVLATIPLAGVVGGFIAQTLIAGRNVYINSITAERSKWIEKLRNNLAGYSASFAKLSSTLANSESELSVTEVAIVLREVNDKAALIRLQLNPRGIIDKNILLLIDAMSAFANADYKMIDRANGLLIAHSQWLLKAEWERVKFEARSGWYRWIHRKDNDVLLAEYNNYAASDGNVNPIIKKFSIMREERGELLTPPVPAKA